MDLKDIFEKLTSYNIFNYLLPGAAFCVIADITSELNLVQDKILNAFFVYYLIGMIISRVGSLIIEPFLKGINFVRFSEYSAYIEKSKTDPLLSTLSEQNNTYRTLLSMFILLIAANNIDLIKTYAPWVHDNSGTLLLACMIVLFAFSYRKQTNYITQRVER